MACWVLGRCRDALLPAAVGVQLCGGTRGSWHGLLQQGVFNRSHCIPPPAAAAGWEGDGQHCQDIDECAMHIDGEPACWDGHITRGAADGRPLPPSYRCVQRDSSAVPFILQRMHAAVAVLTPHLLNRCKRRLRPAVRQHAGVVPLRVQEGIHPGEGDSV